MSEFGGRHLGGRAEIGRHAPQIEAVDVGVRREHRHQFLLEAGQHVDDARGRSEVARTSVSVMAGSGRVSDVTTTATLPLTIAGAKRDTSPSSDDDSGATIPTTPVGSGIVKLKYGAPTGFTVPRAWNLVRPARVPDEPVGGVVHDRERRRLTQAFGRRDLGCELLAPALEELGHPVEDLAAVHRRPVGPSVERAARRADRVPQVLPRRPRSVRERLAIRGAGDHV